MLSPTAMKTNRIRAAVQLSSSCLASCSLATALFSRCQLSAGSSRSYISCSSYVNRKCNASCDSPQERQFLKKLESSGTINIKRNSSSHHAQSSKRPLVGPDRVLPANTLWTTWPDGAVVIRQHDHPSSNYVPKSVWTTLNETVKRVPDRVAVAVKRDGKWIRWTYTEYLEDIKSTAKAFIHLGLKPHHSVCILGFNAPEWAISNIASVVAGGLATGIYTTNSADSVRYVGQHSRANIFTVDDDEQLEKVLSIWPEVSSLATVVQWQGGSRGSLPEGVVSWNDMIELGRSLPDTLLQERLENQSVNQPCMLVYTSGTTGNPKGVMISQDNLTWTSKISEEMYGFKMDSEHGVSYLPLSHVAAQVIDIYLTAYGGGSMHFADKDALQGTLLKTLLEVKPTKFFGVPRVFEKIEEKMKEIGKNNSGLKKVIADWAKAAAFEHHTQRMAGKPGNSLQYRLAKHLVLKRIHAALGLEVAVQSGLYSSAAPLSKETFNYFMSLDMPILELLGSSETGGPQTASLSGPKMRPGSVGLAYPHFETKILNPDVNGEGEIVTRGRNVCMGYLWDEEKTKELIDEEGWIHSGDLGKKDADGFFYVTGRMKEILITGGGENVAPVPIENRIRRELDGIVSHVVVIGDKKKHLAVLITLRCQVDSSNQPLPTLHPDVLAWLQNLGSSATTAKELIREDNVEVREAIKDALVRANKEAISRAQRVHRYLILPEELSLAGGELTPTMKVKRHTLMDKYATQIQEMYEIDQQTSMW